MPRISVIIAAFNAERYIAQCIKSVEAQSIIDQLEIIVVNDGSIDNTATIVANLNNKYNNIRLINRNENMGLIYSRYEGFQQSCGNYIYFMDADDILSPDAMSELLTTAQHNNSDITVMGFYLWLPKINWKIRFYTPSQKISRVSDDNDILQFLINSLYGSNPLCNNLWNKLFRREIVTFQETPRIFLGEDSIISLPIYMNCKGISFTDYMGISWRAGGGSANWQSQKWEDYKRLFVYMEQKLSDIDNSNLNICAVKKIHAENAVVCLIENIAQQIAFRPFSKKKISDYIRKELSLQFWNEIRENLSSDNLTELIMPDKPQIIISEARKHLRQHWAYNYIIRPIASMHK